MEISSSSGKNSSFRNNPWELLESGEAVWADLDGHSREQVVRHYAPKIKILALRLKAKLPSSIELDELISSGSLGLLEALEHFDPGQNIRFNTYAESRIRGAMLDDLRKLDWFSRGMRQRVRLLEQAIQSLEQAGIEPSQDALQEETGLTPREVSEGLEALQNQVCLSLEMVQENFIPVGRDRSENQPFHAAAKQDLLEKLAGLIGELTPREKLVLSLYYTEELNMKETARVMNITEGRVSQLHSQCLAKLRTTFRTTYGSNT